MSGTNILGKALGQIARVAYFGVKGEKMALPSTVEARRMAAAINKALPDEHPMDITPSSITIKPAHYQAVANVCGEVLDCFTDSDIWGKHSVRFAISPENIRAAWPIALDAADRLGLPVAIDDAENTEILAQLELGTTTDLAASVKAYLTAFESSYYSGLVHDVTDEVKEKQTTGSGASNNTTATPKRARGYSSLAGDCAMATANGIVQRTQLHYFRRQQSTGFTTPLADVIAEISCQKVANSCIVRVPARLDSLLASITDEFDISTSRRWDTSAGNGSPDKDYGFEFATAKQAAEFHWHVNNSKKLLSESMEGPYVRKEFEAGRLSSGLVAAFLRAENAEQCLKTTPAKVGLPEVITGQTAPKPSKPIC